MREKARLLLTRGFSLYFHENVQHNAIVHMVHTSEIGYLDIGARSVRFHLNINVLCETMKALLRLSKT